MQSANSTPAAMTVSIAIASPCATAFAHEANLVFDGSEFSASSPDLFQGKPALQPGDSITTRISLTNEAHHRQLFMLSIDEPETLSAQDQALLDAAELIVSSEDGFQYYEGPLSGPDLYDSIVLEECDCGQTITLDLEIAVPSELGVEYVLPKDALRWRFTALPAEDEMRKAWEHLIAIESPGSAWDETECRLTPIIAAGCAAITLGGLAFALGRHYGN